MQKFLDAVVQFRERPVFPAVILVFTMTLYRDTILRTTPFQAGESFRKKELLIKVGRHPYSAGKPARSRSVLREQPWIVEASAAEGVDTFVVPGDDGREGA